MITKEQLLERRNQLLADYHAIGGAVQDCDYWLEQLEEVGDEESPASTDN